MIANVEDAYRDAQEQLDAQYEVLFKLFSALDTKAQGTATIAGVLLAALVTATGRDAYPAAFQVLGPAVLALILVTVGLLVAALFLSFFCLRVRGIPRVAEPAELVTGARELQLLAERERTGEVIARYRDESLDGHLRAVEALMRVDEVKAASLRRAQTCLLGGVCSASTCLVLILFVQALR